jgi:imidazolonepropionase-like amidohydrolase
LRRKFEIAIEDARSPWLHIRAGTLIDGAGQIVRDGEVLIRERKIVEVGRAGSVRVPSTGVREIDARDGTVIPGLIDCHLHVTYSGHVGMQQLEWPRSLELAAVSAGANAAKALRFGYTSALDVGCRGKIGVATKAAIAEGTIRGPDLRVSGQIISTVGGPLDLWPSSMKLDPAARLAALVSGADEIRRVVREQAKDGVDNVKLQISGSTVQSKRGGRASVFADEELRAATDTAHDLGLSTAAHAEGPEAITAAIEAGFDTIQHASFIDDATIALLAAHPRSRLVFTLGVYDDIIHIGPRIGYPNESRERVEAVWDRMVAAVRLAYERGVPFAVGSDAGGAVHPHGRYARDVVLLVRACGIPVEDAIRAATSHAAQAAWLSEVGVIAPDNDADLVVVNGDLTERIELLEDATNIAAVVRKGELAVGGAATRASALTSA